MAVSNMQAVNVIGIIDDIDKVISVLGESGVFHPDDVSAFYGNIKDFTHLKTENNYAELLTDLKSAINLSKHKVELVAVNDFNPTFEEIEFFSKKFSDELNVLIDDREFINDQLIEAKDNLSQTKHFLGLDVEIEKVLTLKYLKSRFGKIPKDNMIKLAAYENNPNVDFTVCTEDKTYCWGIYFSPIENYTEVDRIFSGIGFEQIDVLGVNDTPQTHFEKLESLIPKLENKLSEAEKSINEYFDKNIEKIAKYLSKLEELDLYSKIKTKAVQYGKSFIIVGWVPTESAKQLKHKLSKIKSVTTDFANAKNEIAKSPPVKLKNCFLAKPFEFYTEMYGMPKYNEIDPSLFIAITYIIMFGIMFADVGQGLCLSIVGMLMWKLKKMKIGKILFPCGFSSAFFGLVFGSVFGFEKLLNPLYEALFGLKDEKLIDVMAPESITMILLSAVGIGVLLVIVAMCLNFYSSIKQHNIGKALFSPSGIAGIVFYSSIVFGVASKLIFGWNIVNLPYIICLIVIPYLLIFFSEPLGDLISGEPDWMPESWVGYIMEHLIESIEFLLEYVTNTVSFLRVGAFVLVHTGMMTVVFVLAETSGPAYWPVVVLGNVFVMVLEGLLVSIQVLRLEYYEMFNRFYAGEGRPYEPVKLKTN